ncbi:uncharacterized protein LOC103179914 [Callorhinchus milii]|uniref:uncharacterized protein LOC103179914 n=1 Tax=Callorhinchus milii TaxID=7868 RepID=UPI0004575667|nr:uncharacterized protein LOC103179914 [Callorhinchus milii]|eukprot:gi/632955794/ref/XP_007893640.1/ PREDICTED: uncharacterized protein LOC103179914 [Callorhinchus milii]
MALYTTLLWVAWAIPQTTPMLLGADLGRCSEELVGMQWQENPREGCKLCRCILVSGDAFQECETPLRPSAWPMECERIRIGCGYKVVRKDSTDVECPGWSYTSYKYLIRVGGFDWDMEKGVFRAFNYRADGAQESSNRQLNAAMSLYHLKQAVGPTEISAAFPPQSPRRQQILTRLVKNSSLKLKEKIQRKPKTNRRPQNERVSLQINLQR